MKKSFYLGNTLVIALTILLFIAALFAKGITHDLFLEAGVLLVSIKIILLGFKNSVSNQQIIRKLDEISHSLKNPPHNQGGGDDVDSGS